MSSAGTRTVIGAAAGASPRARVRGLVEAMGEAAVVRWCAALLAGKVRHDDRRHPPITWLGGMHAASLLQRPNSREVDYFPRVWAARALLYAWDASAEPAVVAALGDPAWRVREMAAKVVRRRGLAGAQVRLERMASDPVPRVRVAAERALEALAS